MKNIQHKKLSANAAGEAPNTKNLRGVIADAKALRGKFRSPFGFVSNKARPFRLS